MSASLSGSGTWKGFGGGGERDFIEHINLNLVTANRCLIKGVHITHIHFFFSSSWSPQARFPAQAISWQRWAARSGAGRGLSQGEMFILQSLLAPSPGLFYCCRFKPFYLFLDSLAALSASCSQLCAFSLRRVSGW